jgi:hypothetical protein
MPIESQAAILPRFMGLSTAGEALTMLMADRGENTRERPAMGWSKQSGILGAYGNVVGEKLDDVASLGVAVSSDSLRVAQDSLAAKLDSPAAEELKLTLEVNGIAGLSCDGQVRKLARALGQIIAQKHGIVVEELTGFNGGSNQQVRGSNIVYEA